MNIKACTDMVLNQFQLSKITLKNLNQFKLSPTAKLVLLALVDCYNPKNEEIYPKQKTIADNLGISLKSVQRAIKEIAAAHLVIYETKTQNRYKFTSTFFELLKMSSDMSKNVPSQKDKLSHTCYEQKNEYKNNKVLNFQLTEFQKKYADIFEKLSESELIKYKSLQGFEKESWLKTKRRELFQEKSSKELQIKIENEKQNTASPLDFDKNQAVTWLNNLPDFLHGSFFAVELRKKWSL